MYNRKNSRLRWRTWVHKRPLEFGARRCTEERGRYECDTCIQGMAPYALLTATMPPWHGGSGTLSTLPVERAAVLVGGGTPVPLFLANSGGVPACVPVAGEDDRIMDGPIDESCSLCCLSSFRSSDLALKLGSVPVTRRFRPFPCWVRWCSLSY